MRYCSVATPNPLQPTKHIKKTIAIPGFEFVSLLFSGIGRRMEGKSEKYFKVNVSFIDSHLEPKWNLYRGSNGTRA